MQYKKLTINEPSELIFGHAPQPVKTRRGLHIGGGIVYPELNFTLPTIEVSKNNYDEVSEHYRDIVTRSLKRAVELGSQGVVLEFETVVEMTQVPEIGIELIKEMNSICEDYFQKYQLPVEIRLTPNDLREFENPPKQSSSKYLEPMMKLFEEGAKAGGDLLSIESTGGKEISDDALLMCDIRTFIFSQAVLGVRDMNFLWKKIVDIARKHNKIPAGDTACGFGNTAMVLAEKMYIPRLFAAIARVATVVRSLVAFEAGAIGPDKDCAYEGPFLKAIAGIPISMEGRTAACAHLSPLGNITTACADLWSNESVQNVQLLAGMAPTVYMEQLEYDARLMNQAIKQGKADILKLQELNVNSDALLDPQAFILMPTNVIEISKSIVKGKNYVEATKMGCIKALNLIKQAYEDKQLRINEMELPWLSSLVDDLESIPDNEKAFIAEMEPTLEKNKVLFNEYNL